MKLMVLAGCLCGVGVALASPGQNPAQRTPPLIIESMTGQDSFAFYCAPCHGRGGKGDGPVATALKTPPSDLTILARRKGGTFPRADVVSFVSGVGRALAAHGTNDMPVWRPTF